MCMNMQCCHVEAQTQRQKLEIVAEIGSRGRRTFVDCVSS